MNGFYRYLAIIFVLAMLFTKVGNIQAQITIPAGVLSIFNEKYPGSTEIVWQKSLFKYVASFKNANSELCLIEFSSSGNWKYTKSEILYKDLPKEIIKTYENSLYEAANGWSVSGVDKFESPDIPFAYRIHIHKGAINKKAVYIAETGKMIKIENDL
ncbi:MAG: PepSY-like domain-containing protein [Solitalea-like symbiont of Acarus siro]